MMHTLSNPPLRYDIEAKTQGHEVIGKSSKELDLSDRSTVFNELRKSKPDA